MAPNSIINVDETGCSTVQKHMQKVVAMKGKNRLGRERGVNTTMVCAVNP